MYFFSLFLISHRPHMIYGDDRVLRLSPTVPIQKEEAFHVLGRPQLKGHGSKTALLQQATQTSSRASSTSPGRATSRRPQARRRRPTSHELELATPPASTSPSTRSCCSSLAAPHVPPRAGLAAVPALPLPQRRTWGPCSRKGGGAHGTRRQWRRLRRDGVAGMEEHDAGVEVAATIAAEGSPSPTPASAVLWSRSWTLVVCFQWWARRLCVETQKDRAKTHF